MHIHDSSLETLTRSALNASANRARSKRSTINAEVVEIINEEDGAAATPREGPSRTENDIVFVLPSALRALLALWECVVENLPKNTK